MSKVVEADAKPDENTGKLKEETVLELLLLVWNCVTELVMREALNRCDFSPQGKNGNLAMDVVRQVCYVYNVKASFEKLGSVNESRVWLHIGDQCRLEGKGDCERCDTWGLTVDRGLMLSMDPRMEFMGEMQVCLLYTSPSPTRPY